MLKKKLLILSCLLFAFCAQAQVFPPQGKVYKDDEVSRIDIILPADSLALLYAELENVYEFHATVLFNNALISHDTLLDVGFRLRGNTSLVSAKKSFKLSFNTYVPGRKYNGLEKINLNGEHNDPSIIRSKLCWDLYQDFGIPAPRAAHTQVYINGNYYGLYINVEHIDEQFIKSRFGNNNGNLYKCLYPADLQYLGPDPNLYKLMTGAWRVYELHTNTATDDYSDLANFIDVLNNTEDDSLQVKLDAVFNVQSYLKYLVIECLTGHWDAYSFNMNNFYLYHNLNTGKFEFIPYDLDNTFGIDWMNIDWGIRNIYNMAASDPRPLTKRLLQNDLYRKEFSFYANQFLREYYNTTNMFPRIDSIYNMIYGYASFDTYRTMDYGWNMQQFTDSYTQLLGGHVKYGLKPFIGVRNTAALQQLTVPATPGLFVNEFMASNTSTIADEYGEYDDWIEIYNGDNNPVWLGDKYLTDNLNKPDKWQLPQMNLNAGEFLLIWADGTPNQGDHHTNYKLATEGEQIGIFTSPANGSIPIDILTYGQQSPDVPNGLLPNGAGMMRVLLTPSPAASNNINLGIENEVPLSMDLMTYPNPFHDQLFIRINKTGLAAGLTISLHDVLGRLVSESLIPAGEFQQGQDISIYPGAITPGMYFLSVSLKDAAGKTYTLPGKKLIKN